MASSSASQKSARSTSLPQAASVPQDVTRHVSSIATAILWGRAAGRCEFRQCNKPLWKSPVTQEPVNIAQRAHIYSFSPHGPRGRGRVPLEKLNSCENLLLVCHACHQKIDKQKDGGRYTADLLREMKAEHERRIEVVTGVLPNRRSEVLLYGANIGQHSSPLSFRDAAAAMFPDYFPASDQCIELGLANSAATDRDSTFWTTESRQLTTLFERRVRDRISQGDLTHLSVFALAPQPLLIQLGTLLGDIIPAVVYQRHREPPSWSWIDSESQLALRVEEPAANAGRPALLLALSATITTDRITAVLGPDVALWRVTVDAPHNDIVKSPEHTAQFRNLLRPLLDRIKAVHGQTTSLHVFPAVPASIAVEFGRIRMPKADMPWEIYDQNSALGGFVHALSIPAKDQ